MQVLLADSDAAFCETLTGYFALNDEFEFIEKRHGVCALRSAGNDALEVALLSVGLPDLDGFQVCKLMRQRGFTAPIILLGESDIESDMIFGLESGADDYVARSVAPSVLRARIRAHVRRYRQCNEAVFQVGPYLFRAASNLLSHRETGREVRLSGTEAAILRRLCLAGNRVVPRADLIGAVWGDNAQIPAQRLTAHIFHLRQKLKTGPSQAALLKTERGGYRILQARRRTDARSDFSRDTAWSHVNPHAGSNANAGDRTYAVE